jgi:guanylate kinase
MGKIFYIMGKSASGKDTIYKEVSAYFSGVLRTLISYTTRPIREGEKDGVEYFFVTKEKADEFAREGKIIELREYQTVMGPWMYFTADDEQIDLQNDSYLVIGTLESYLSMRNYFGEHAMVPIYVEVEDGERLTRALNREKMQGKPNFSEVCRRYLADEQDFSEEKLVAAGIDKRFQNHVLEDAVKEIEEYIERGNENG